MHGVLVSMIYIRSITWYWFVSFVFLLCYHNRGIVQLVGREEIQGPVLLLRRDAVARIVANGVQLSLKAALPLPEFLTQRQIVVVIQDSDSWVWIKHLFEYPSCFKHFHLCYFTAEDSWRAFSPVHYSTHFPPRRFVEFMANDYFWQDLHC